MLNFRCINLYEHIVISHVSFLHDNKFLALFLFLLLFGMLSSYFSFSFLHHLSFFVSIIFSLLVSCALFVSPHCISPFLFSHSVSQWSYVKKKTTSFCVELNICPQIAAINYSNWNSYVSYVKCSINNMCVCVRAIRHIIDMN